VVESGMSAKQLQATSDYRRLSYDKAVNVGLAITEDTTSK